MPPTTMTSSEEAVVRLRQELQAGDNPDSVLQRIKDSIIWAPALAQSAAGKDLFAAISSSPWSPAWVAANAAYHAQLRDAEWQETEERWWSYPPVTADVSEVLELTFIDATPGDERWEPERIPCSAGEPFSHAAQRFRVVANKKHRHPLRPSLDYNLILEVRGSTRATFDSVASRTVSYLLGELKNGHSVQYVRDDGRPVDLRRWPALLFAPWDRARIMPSWCTTPESWFEPVPPPGFNAAKVPVDGAQFYLAVPTLHIPGIGIVPSASKPQLIARTLYWPVRYLKLMLTLGEYPLDEGRDYVPVPQRLVSSALTTEAARALLGRYIQSSSDIPRDDEPPKNKKRKKIASASDSQTLAIAWGLTLDDEGQPDWLHCVQPLLQWQDDYALDLKGLSRSLGQPHVRYKNCVWIGAAVLDADRRALECNVEENELQEVQRDGSSDWTERTQQWIKNLNTEGIDKLVEVAHDGAFVAGDIELSKADTDEWEAVILGAKPGLWRVFIGASGTVHLAWVREGELDYNALPQFSGDVVESEGDNWEELASFSVDSGMVGLFSKSALDTLVGDCDKQFAYETLVDAMNLDDLGGFMPGGIIISGDDGGYVVEGIKDDDGEVVKLRMRAD
ncbi:hypothetical protein EXIGLDRAFT_829935 [Exidia glandulosa HHB12029]|uniref:Uncharacterized protein n=1 Tax=Exidia glandulosa HHB12029 TaxID=1314781 RepID=A0A165P037_EXIGL|nr:hypothetical protein EXIGLDRAFT_829935 [Exidia glandulosa HHB12029]